MNLSMRRYQTDKDFELIREFLHEVFLLNDRKEYSWPAARFDYWYWHGIKNLGDGQLDRDVFIWEDGDGAPTQLTRNAVAPGTV